MPTRGRSRPRAASGRNEAEKAERVGRPKAALGSGTGHCGHVRPHRERYRHPADGGRGAASDRQPSLREPAAERPASSCPALTRLSPRVRTCSPSCCRGDRRTRPGRAVDRRTAGYTVLFAAALAWRRRRDRAPSAGRRRSRPATATAALAARGHLRGERGAMRALVEVGAIRRARGRSATTSSPSPPWRRPSRVAGGAGAGCSAGNVPADTMARRSSPWRTWGTRRSCAGLIGGPLDHVKIWAWTGADRIDRAGRRWSRDTATPWRRCWRRERT